MTSFAPAGPEVTAREEAVAEQGEAVAVGVVTAERAPVVAVSAVRLALVGPQWVQPVPLASAEEPACLWHGPRTST